MRHRLLQTGPLLSELETRLARDYDVHPLWKEADAKAFLAAHGAQFEGLVSSARVGASTELLGALPSLKVITSFGVGLDTFDLATIRARGIALGYTSEVLNDCVADTAMFLTLDAARRFSDADRYLRAGHWHKAGYPLSTKVSGKRMGILGLGRIGRAIARRATGFDMEVRYHNRRPVDDVPYAYMSSLKEMASWADFLMIASAGGESTRGLVSREILDALGPKGYLVNISRGAIVDEPALVDALVAKRIAGAGLDVFEHEPHVPDALLGLDNVVLIPHVASNTHETRSAMAQRVGENLDAFFAGQPLPSSAL